MTSSRYAIQAELDDEPIYIIDTVTGREIGQVNRFGNPELELEIARAAVNAIVDNPER